MEVLAYGAEVDHQPCWPDAFEQSRRDPVQTNRARCFDEDHILGLQEVFEMLLERVEVLEGCGERSGHACSPRRIEDDLCPLSNQEQSIEVTRREQRAELSVRALGARAKIEHVSQDRDLALRSGVLAQGGQRCAGADRVGVVSVVDKRDASGRGVDLEAHRRDLVERQAALDLLDRDAEFARCRDRRRGVRQVVLARCVKLEGVCLPIRERGMKLPRPFGKMRSPQVHAFHGFWRDLAVEVHREYAARREVGGVTLAEGLVLSRPDQPLDLLTTKEL